jgi:hypothetical protein
MSKSRLPLYLGLGAAAAGGYYLYAAGGIPKQATKKFEGGLNLLFHCWEWASLILWLP